MPLIGCGGVEDAATALAKIEAGASLVQLYSSLALNGVGVVEAILEGLGRRGRGAWRVQHPLARRIAGEGVGRPATIWCEAKLLGPRRRTRQPRRLPLGGLNRYLVAIGAKPHHTPAWVFSGTPASASIADSSPDWNISRAMSQPPTNSPLT